MHEAAAQRAGLAPEVISAIREGREPTGERDDERVARTFTQERLETRTVSPATYERAVGVFGLELLIEMVTVIGFYTTAAMMINSFDAPVPGDARPLPNLISPKR